MIFKRKNSGCIWKDTIVSSHSGTYQKQEFVYIHRKDTIIVWDKTLANRNILIHISSEIYMSSTLYQETKYQKGGITIVLAFPKQSEQTEQADNLRQEIRSILFDALREQLQKIS